MINFAKKIIFRTKNWGLKRNKSPKKTEERRRYGKAKKRRND
jgi:hypothetical protein